MKRTFASEGSRHNHEKIKFAKYKSNCNNGAYIQFFACKKHFHSIAANLCAISGLKHVCMIRLKQISNEGVGVHTKKKVDRNNRRKKRTKSIMFHNCQVSRKYIEATWRGSQYYYIVLIMLWYNNVYTRNIDDDSCHRIESTISATLYKLN